MEGESRRRTPDEKVLDSVQDLYVGTDDRDRDRFHLKFIDGNLDLKGEG